MHAMFQDRLGEHSFDLHHIAGLAAALESPVHAETIVWLRCAYKLCNLLKHGNRAAVEEIETVVGMSIIYCFNLPRHTIRYIIMSKIYRFLCSVII